MTLHIVFFAAALAVNATAEGGELGPDMPQFRVRPGYKVSIASVQMEETRFMEFDDKGNLYVSSPKKGTITTLRDTDGDGVYEIAAEFVSGMPQVHGLHFYNGWLWFAQSLAVHRGRDTNGDGIADEVVTILPEGSIPGGAGHWWRPIFVTEDGFYTSVGCSGNITAEDDTDRQKLFLYKHDGSSRKLIASGIRNTEKYRYRPGTKEVWGVDHNSDWYGRELGEKKGFHPVTDQQPPCEFNKYVEGGFYGHPYITGNRLPRLEFYDHPDILELAAKTIMPEWNFGAHWAPNGFIFIENNTHFPKDHNGDALVACHGSWNSTTRVGYRIERILFDDLTGKPYGSLCLVSTITADDLPSRGEGVLARPVDCVQAPDGTILFSCDFTNRIYRLSYAGQKIEPGY